MNENKYSIELTTPVYGGDTLGRLPDGRAVFVPFALPGETVEVRIVEEKRGYVRAELLDVLQSSAERILPLCPHFGECGGCQYQMLSYKNQLAIKKSILGDQLTRIGKLENPNIKQPVPSTKDFNYRNYVQFHLSRDGQLGFHRPRSKEVLPIKECHLPETSINLICSQLDLEVIPEISQLGIRLGAEEDLQIILKSKDLDAPEITVVDLPISVVHLSPAGALVLAGSDLVYFEILGRTFQVSSRSFFQANTPMAAAMVKHILDFLSDFGALSSETTLIDTYCGVGLFSAFLAPRVKRLIGIESNASACEDYIVNLDEFDNVELFESSAEIVLPNLDISSDVILVDPPRAGLDKRALDGLVNLSPPVILYVSCDPSTLARDCKRLSAVGYKLKQMTPFDLFPQTKHIESISIWIL